MGLLKNPDFQGMLNEYLPNELLQEEFVARDYVMGKVDKDNNWLAATDGSGSNAIIVPIKVGGASSVRYGAYTAEGEISQSVTKRGKILDAKELHGSMIFNQRDLEVHGKLNEQNFLKLLPGEIEDFMGYIKNIVSIGMLSGKSFAKATAVGSIASGIVSVNRPDRFEIGQLVEIFDGTTALYSEAAGGSEGNELFVIEIDISAKTVTLSATRGGSAATLTNITIGCLFQNHDAYKSADQTFQSIPDVLLSAANGGSANYVGFAKKAYPFLQAYNKDGSSITSTNIMDVIFDFVTEMRIYSKAAPTEVLMSLRNFSYCMRVLELQKGAFNVTPGSRKGSQYGWMEIEIGSPKGGMLKFVGIQECDDEYIIAMDWSAMKFYSDGGLRKHVGIEGLEYHTLRLETGYKHIIDFDLYGELVVLKPHRLGILHSIP